MRLEGIVSCQHRRLVLVTLDWMGGDVCFLFPRENKILGDEKSQLWNIWRCFPAIWGLLSPASVSHGSTGIALGALLQLPLECWRPVLAGWDLMTELVSVWQWPGPQLQSCRQRLWGKPDSSASWIHMEVPVIPNVTWKAVKLALTLAPAFHSHRENTVRGI